MGLTQITTGGVDDNINIDSNTLKVDGTNNRVGIGTTSPATALHVSGSGTQRIRITGTGSANAILTLDAPSGFANYIEYGASASTPLAFYDVANTAERMRIDSSGNVGIGTSSPGTILNIRSNTSDDGILLEKTDGTDIARLFFDGTSTDARFDMFSGGSANIQLKANGVSHFSGGNVGIGTSSPARGPLHINSSTADTYFHVTNSTTGSSASDGFTLHQSGNETLLNNRESGNMRFYTAGSERMRIDSSGNVGIGTTSPESNRRLTVDIGTTSANVAVFKSQDTGGGSYIGFMDKDTTNGNRVRVGAINDSMAFITAGSEAARFDTSGRLLVGNTSSAGNSTLQVQGLTGLDARGAIQLQYNGSPSGSTTMSEVRFTDSSGNQGAVIGAKSASTWASNDYPGELTFSTTADSATSPTERMRITSGGTLLVGQTNESFGTNGHIFQSDGAAYHVRVSNPVLLLNRQSSDGEIVRISQDGNTEGTISVSGSDVSYNGATLSRYSQLAGGAERTEVLRGSVMSNLDEMCEWGEEDNEQLNRSKVSDVEGDRDVAGVFRCWDDDDDVYTNDFYLAMTGDFVIRIAQGTTVARGDLLMSAGDGTAKPQDDDIVRSKTIAKVTSTTVSTTYADGSYCVPCVLMAC